MVMVGLGLIPGCIAAHTFGSAMADRGVSIIVWKTLEMPSLTDDRVLRLGLVQWHAAC